MNSITRTSRREEVTEFEVNVSRSSVAELEGRRQRRQVADLVHAIPELMKIRITFFVGMSAAFGYIIASGGLRIGMILPVTGIFVMACASAATNHYQEIDTDAMMHRTNKRPLPAGMVTPAFVMALIVSLAVTGSLLVLLTGNGAALVLSWLAFFSYNLIYTPMKKATPFAVIPGSFVGSFPVMAGWAASGGNLFDPRLMAIAAFFFIWQIPHFWLLMDLYSADYERAKFPTLRMSFSEKTVAIMIFAWMVILAASSFFFVTTGVVGSTVAQAAVAALGFWLVTGTFSIIVHSGEKHASKSAFMKINIYVLAVTLVVMIDKVIGRI